MVLYKGFIADGGIAMKKRLFKRSLSFLLVAVMLFGTTISVLAKENSNDTDVAADVINITPDLLNTIELTDSNIDMEVIEVSIDVNPLSNNQVGAVVPANGTENIYPTLDSYFGLYKTFYVNATSEGTKAGLFLYLYDPNGKLVSDDWIMGTNGAATWDVFLPTSGQWRLYIVALATEKPVVVWAGWK